jgi:putative ABC transport system permease protein
MIVDVLRRSRRRLLASFRPGREDAALSREVSAHLGLLEDDFVARGMSREEARYAARRAFGGVEQVKERQRDERAFGSIGAWWLDLKLGGRMLVKYPALTIVAGVGLAMAIALGAIGFAVFYGAIHPTLPLEEGDRIVGLETWDTARNNQEFRVLHDYAAWRQQLTTIHDLAAFREIQRNLITAGAQPEAVSGAEITASGFRLARVAPLIGRTIVEADEHPNAPPIAVLGYDMWRSRFASDPDVVGRVVRVGERDHIVVGVMPPGFAFPFNQKLWIPLQEDPAAYDRRRGPDILVCGRLAPGVTFEQAQAELSTIAAGTANAFPDTHAQLRPSVVRFTEIWFDWPTSQTHMLQTALMLLLVLVAVNVASLLYARTATRESELAIRVTLGASRGRLVGQLLLEALVLSLVAAAAGLGIASVALRLAGETAQSFAATIGGLPFWMTFGASTGMVVYTAGLALLAAAVTGLLPALKATQARTPAHLAQLTGNGRLRLGKVWTTLIVAQVAVAVTALPVAVGLSWEAIRVAAAAPAFAQEEFVLAAIVMDQDPATRTEAGTHRRDLQRRYGQRIAALVERLEGEPGIRAVTVTSARPGAEPVRTIEIDGAPGAERARSVYVGTDFFETFGVPLLAGRAFRREDLEASDRTVIVNQAFVREILGGGDVLGRRLRYAAGASAPSHTIVGVVGDFPSGPPRPGTTQARLYHPVAAGNLAASQLAISVAPGVRDSVELNLRIIAASVHPSLRARIESVGDPDDVAMFWGASGLAIVTLSVVLLAAAGIHALVSFTVTRRRKEIGIRVALGADRGRILRNIFSRAFRQLAAGVIAGLAIARPLLGSEGNHKVLLPAAAAFMTLVGLAAAVGPIRRALRLDPIETLRGE